MRRKLTLVLINKILKGQKNIYEKSFVNGIELRNYYTQLSYTFNYGEWYFYNNDKSFPLKDFNKTWFV